MPRVPIARVTPNEPTKFVGVKFPEGLLHDLDDLAAERSSDRSRLLREAVRRFIAAEREREAAA